MSDTPATPRGAAAQSPPAPQRPEQGSEQRPELRPGEVPPPPLAPGLTRPLPLPQAYVPLPAVARPRRLRPLAVAGLAAAAIALGAGAVIAGALLVPHGHGSALPREPDHGTYGTPLPGGRTADYPDGVRVTVGDARVAATGARSADTGAPVEFTVTVTNGSSHRVSLDRGNVSAFTEGDDAGPAYDRLTGTLAPGAVRSAHFTVLVPAEETLEVDVSPDRTYHRAVWQLDVP